MTHGHVSKRCTFVEEDGDAAAFEVAGVTAAIHRSGLGGCC